MANFTATSRVPTRPLSYENKSMAYRKELLVDYTNGMIYVIDENGIEHSIAQQVYEQLIEQGDISNNVTVVIPNPDDPEGEPITVTLTEALTQVINNLDVVKQNISSIQQIIESLTSEEGTLEIDPSDIVQDATHRFLTDAQISRLQQKVNIVEVTITINPADVSGSTAPYQCTKAVAGVDPSYPAPTIDIAYTNDDYETNNAEEDAYYCIHRCQILNANEAVFTFKEKPETAFQVLFQIKVPGIS